MKQKTLWILALSWIPQGFFMRYCQLNPLWVQQYYRQEFYQKWHALRAAFFDAIPFSLGDLCYAFCFLLFLGWLLLHGQKALKQLLQTSLNTLALLAVIHAFYQFSWGLNYYQQPLSNTLQIAENYTDLELELTTQKLIQRTHHLHSNLTKADSLQVVFPREKSAYLSSINNTNTKASLWSLPLSYMGYAGYLNPFTGEAHINDRLPTLILITTAAHEQAHQEGWAAENEANFQAFLHTYRHPDPYVQFASYSFALRYTWNALSQRNPGCAAELAQQLHPGIKKDFQMLQNFWKAYKNPIQPWINSFYDFFLKANGQKNGVQSYNQVVAFLIHYYDQL